MTEPHRKPAAFRLDDPRVVVAETSDARELTKRAPGRGVRVMPEPDTLDLPVPAEQVVPAAARRPRFSWSAVLWAALGGLVSLALGLAVTSLIEELFARATWLGTVGLALALLAALALLVIALKEIVGLARLRAVEKLRGEAEAAIATDDRERARALVRELLALLAHTPALARRRAEFANHLTEIIDGADLVRLAERDLMVPLDQEACRLVSAAATRVSLVTAVSPRAALDMAFVFISALGLIRRLAALYGGRPGTLGLLRLMRRVIVHVTVTGGIAATDSLIQQMLGHGVAAKLSAKLGEGMLNGLLTARLGLAAIELARPLPFAALPRPRLADVAADLLRRRAAVDPPRD
jgi:putative membrane protein